MQTSSEKYTTIRVVGTHTWQAGRERIFREEDLALPIIYFFFLISIFKDMKKKRCPNISKYVSGCLVHCSLYIFLIQFEYSRIEIFVYIYILE